MIRVQAKTVNGEFWEKDFGRAFDNPVRGIGPSMLPLVTLVVSSRISDWKAQSDRDELLDRFYVSKEAEDKQKKADGHIPAFRIVQLEPLDKKRVRKFAEGMGLKDSDAFIVGHYQGE